MAENPKYKLYYRLMDLALLAGILGLLDFLGAHVFNLSFTQILNPEPPLDRPTLDLVMTWWMVSALAFVAIFQFLRWRDSR